MMPLSIIDFALKSVLVAVSENCWGEGRELKDNEDAAQN